MYNNLWLDRRAVLSLTAIVAILGTIGAAASAQTVTVTTSADVVDVDSSATIADLPGPDGVVSFREALLVSDNEPERQTIGFEIPEDDWYLPDIYPGLVLLQGSFSFSASQPVTIDGTTQTAFTGDTNPDGNELILPLQTYLGGAGTEVTGLHASRVEISGSGSDIYGNTGSMYIVVYNGTRSHVHDNEAWTIKISYSDDNIIVRNTTQRVRVTGAGSFGPPAQGNRIGGPDVSDRNFITGFGNYGEHGVPSGDCIELYYTRDTLIQNNYIGTTPDGMAISNRACTVGIAMFTENDNVIIRDNLIAIHAVGVYPIEGVSFGQEMYIELYQGGTGIEITGNTMGLNALVEPVLGGVNGIVVSRYAFEHGAIVDIGGSQPGQGNVIAGHLSTGVLMTNGPGVPQTGHIRLSGNSIYANDEIGIDLMPNTWDFGPTPNDPLDADTGANGLQNFPDIASAAREGSGVHVVGSLHSSPLGEFTVEFFASPECHASGFGEGQMFLGSAGITTDAAGDADFDVLLAASVPDGWVMTSTATLEPVGSTSEFSACVQVTGEGLAGDIDGDGDVDLADLATLLASFGTCVGDSGFNPDADLDDSGCVDLADLATLLANFGT
jgi:hypothetical protein